MDLAAYLNATYYDPRDYTSKLRLFEEETAALLGRGVETVVFTSHLDACSRSVRVSSVGGGAAHAAGRARHASWPGDRLDGSSDDRPNAHRRDARPCSCVRHRRFGDYCY